MVKKFSSIHEVRNSIDKLDLKIMELISQRKQLVEHAVKHKSKEQIVDQKRIYLILKNIKKKSIKHKIDPKITNKIWKNMIYAYIDFEKRNFNKKK